MNGLFIAPLSQIILKLNYYKIVLQQFYFNFNKKHQGYTAFNINCQIWVVNEFEIAFQSHIQFEVIHPFIDGNGRVGRILMNWLLIREKLSPIAIQMKNRNKYIEILENSRRGKIEAICLFCFEEYLNSY